MAEPKALLSELLRPQQLGDVTLPQKTIDRLQRMIDTDSIMNLLFYGAPGAGKTSAARLIKARYEHGSIERSGPTLRTADDVGKEITSFAMTKSLLSDKRKLCFIDDADAMSKPAQAVLRNVIENTSGNCRFIVAVNNETKLQLALRSRLQGISFNVLPENRKEVIARLFNRYERTLTEHHPTFDHARLNEIVHVYYPDLRAIAN